jgi:hypothetical protein
MSAPLTLTVNRVENEPRFLECVAIPIGHDLTLFEHSRIRLGVPHRDEPPVARIGIADTEGLAGAGSKKLCKP